MSGIAETFSNPYVLGGGALLGIVLLMGKKNAATADSTVSPAYSSAVVALNTAAMQQVTAQAQISANVAINAHKDDTQKQIAIYATMKAAGDNNQVIQVQQAQSFQGIIQTQISTQGAVTMDILNNANRLGLAQQQTIQSVHHDNSAVQIAQEQAKAAKNASNNNLIGNIIKTVASVAAAPFTGGASLLGLGTLSTSTPSVSSLVASGFTNTGPQLGDPIY